MSLIIVVAGIRAVCARVARWCLPGCQQLSSTARAFCDQIVTFWGLIWLGLGWLSQSGGMHQTVGVIGL